MRTHGKPIPDAGNPLDAVLRSAVEDAVRTVVLPMLDERLPAIPATSTPNAYLTVKQAAERAQVADATIRRWIKAGGLPRRWAGRHARVMVEDLDAFMKKPAARPSDMTTDEQARRLLGKASRPSK